MNRISSSISRFKTVLVILISFYTGANVMAKDKGCWVDFFEGAQYTGKQFQLTDSAQLANLDAINGENWTGRISSLKVGSKATVTVYDDINFKLTATEMAKSPDLMRSWGITEKDIKEESELIFNANAMIHDLSDFGFHQKVKSLKVRCN